MSQSRKATQTIFERIGGQKAIKRVIDQFYQFLLSDDRVNTFLIENVSDVAKIHRTLAEFVGGILGGPWKYQGRDMKTIHKNMPITNEHFEIVWGHLQSAFLVLRVDADLIAETKEVVETLRKDIVQIHN